MADLTNILGGAWSPPREPTPALPEHQLIDAIRGAGLEPPESITMDGNIHRFRSGSKGRGAGDKTGWYVAYGDGAPAGRFGCWRAGIEQSWRADIGRKLSPAEEMAHIRRMAEAAAQRDAERKRAQEVAADTVEAIWTGCTGALPDHPYLARKGVQPHGARVTGDGRLVVPLYDENGELASLQYIASDGSKLYHSGGKTGGCFALIGTMDAPGVLYIAEGYATAATIHETTGRPCVVAYSASNLVNICGMLRERFGQAQELVIVADNDASGTGQKYADQCAAKYGARVVMPPDQGMDANDYRAAGGDLAALLEPPPADDWLVPVSDMLAQPAPLRWLVKGWIPEQCLGMIHGPSGSGKTFVMLDICLSIAAGIESWNGNKSKRGCVIYLAGEGNYGMRSRVAAWLQHHHLKSADMLVSKSGCDLNTPTGWAHAMQYIRQVAATRRVVAVVVDTLHRFLKGDENSAEDAKTMIDACDAIKREAQCSVWLVHHTGLADSAQNRARGSSAWRGALDVELGINGEGDKKALAQHKMKDAEQARPLQFALEPVEIDGWTDEDGEPVKGTVVKWLGEAEPASKKATKADEAMQSYVEAWRALGCETDAEGRPVVSATAWRDWMIKNGVPERTAKNKTIPSRDRPSDTLGYLIKCGKVKKGLIEGLFVPVDKLEIATITAFRNVNES